MAKEVLITGASGFIGRNLAEQLGGLTPTHRQLELNSMESVDAYFQAHDVDVVVHCATRGDRTDFDPDNNDLRMFLNLAEQCVPIITIGSGAEYDKSRPITRVKELEFGSHVPKDTYGFGKYAISRFIEKTEGEYLCLRPFGVFGRYEDTERRFISNAILRAIRGEPIIVYQDVRFDYLYIDDLVKTVGHFLESGPPWPWKFYNLGGHTTTLLDLARRINRLTGNREIKVLNKREKGKEYTADTARLRNEFDFKMTPLDDALQAMIDWYK